MRYLYILVLSIFLGSCNSVPKEYLSNNNICNYNNPIFKISKDELKLNPNIQKQLQNKKGDLTITDNRNYKKEYLDLGDNDITKIEINKDLNISKWIRYNNNKAKWSLFKYENGKSKIFKEAYYDEQGYITKVIDYEQGYKICWAEAIEIVKKVAKKEIKKYNITDFNLSRVDLNEFPKEKPVWLISLDGNEEYELKDTKVYWIDGVTGDFLKTTKIITTYD